VKSDAKATISAAQATSVKSRTVKTFLMAPDLRASATVCHACPLRRGLKNRISQRHFP
jgi:hypothetical protein